MASGFCMRPVDCVSYIIVLVYVIHVLCELSLLAEFPSTWGAYDKNPQTKVVTLDPKDEEYVDVKNTFETSSGRKGTIVKIERIQNPTLYAQYAARKKLMDQTNPSGTQNERRLYHGCAGDSVQGIIHGGFNRSYAGKNGKY